MAETQQTIPTSASNVEETIQATDAVETTKTDATPVEATPQDQGAAEAQVDKVATATETTAPTQEEPPKTNDSDKPEEEVKPVAAKKEKRQSIVSKLFAFVREKSPKKADEKKVEEAKQPADVTPAAPVPVEAAAAAPVEPTETAPAATAETAPTAITETAADSSKAVEETKKGESATAFSKEKLGRRLSARIGSFLPKAKVPESKEADSSTKPSQANGDATETAQAPKVAGEPAKAVVTAAA